MLSNLNWFHIHNLFVEIELKLKLVIALVNIMGCQKIKYIKFLSGWRPIFFWCYCAACSYSFFRVIYFLCCFISFLWLLLYWLGSCFSSLLLFLGGLANLGFFYVCGCFMSVVDTCSRSELCMHF